MFDLLFENTAMPVLGKVLTFAEQRQRVLAHNVANINTPGFRQTDLPVAEFTAALSTAINNRAENTPHRFEMPSTRHIRFDEATGQMDVEARPVEGLMNYYDGSDRSVEHLQNEMLKNAIWHEAAMRLLSQQGKLMETAIRERIS